MGADILGARLDGRRDRHMDLHSDGYGRPSRIGRSRHTGHCRGCFRWIFPFQKLSRGSSGSTTVAAPKPDGCAKTSELVEKMMRRFIHM